MMVMETSDARLAETHAQISHIFESRSQETAHRRETINTTSRFKDIKDDISMCYGEKLNMVDDMLNRLPSGAQNPIGPSSSGKLRRTVEPVQRSLEESGGFRHVCLVSDFRVCFIIWFYMILYGVPLPHNNYSSCKAQVSSYLIALVRKVSPLITLTILNGEETQST